MKPSTPSALANIEEAMVLVEQAQNDLNRACQKLSSIRYGVDLYKKCGVLQLKVEALWYFLQRVRDSRERMSIDSEPEP